MFFLNIVQIFSYHFGKTTSTRYFRIIFVSVCAKAKKDGNGTQKSKDHEYNFVGPGACKKTQRTFS